MTVYGPERMDEYSFEEKSVSLRHPIALGAADGAPDIDGEMLGTTEGMLDGPKLIDGTELGASESSVGAELVEGAELVDGTELGRDDGFIETDGDIDGALLGSREGKVEGDWLGFALTLG